MRTCNTCAKAYEDFGQRAAICRPCKREYDRKFHAKRTAEQKARKLSLQRQRQIENRQFMYDYLSEHPCELCGESDPVVLEFDHIDQTTKTKAVSIMTYNSLEKIKEEILKCRVLCANCHKRHTAVQLGWYKDIKR